MARGHDRGREGEDFAARYLEAQGWSVLDRNWRAGHAELDLVIRRGAVVAFVEVKTRTDGRCGDPLEAVTARKRSEVERVARAWLRARGPDVGGRLELRFDAVGVLLSPGCPPMLRHVEDAWRAGNSG